MEAGKEQQYGKIGLCWCIIVSNPIIHAAKKEIGSPVSNNTAILKRHPFKNKQFLH
jgi:hypothetical protein